MSTSAAPGPGNVVRLTPWHLDDLPSHPSIPEPAEGADAKPKPRLLNFVLAVLEDGASFLAPASFPADFAKTGTKPAPPASAEVEIYKRSLPSSALSQIPWSSSPIPRRKPAALETEHWFVRRSVHSNKSSKEQKGSASWEEFVYGLRDEHSHHEFDFTPNLYDAHHILDWNGEMRKLEEEGSLGAQYSSVTMSIYEMCHAIPSPLDPRCFAVLVLTAATSSSSFLAVTVPVDLTRPKPLKASFYSSQRNLVEGKDRQQRKSPVMGFYAAVETVRTLDDGDIEWVMTTASDAKGILPMWAQKLGLPGAIVKDVSYFMEWIPSVSEEDIAAQEVGTH